MHEHIRTWESDTFRLDLYATERTDWRGQTVLAYEFYDQGELIFKGEDFAGSPMHADDSDESVAALLSFLSLRPGDTDAEYLESYTPAQMAWCEDRGEELSMHAYDLEHVDEEAAERAETEAARVLAEEDEAAERRVLGCDQCEVLSINGVACHETGCPRAHIDPATGRFYTRRCRWCDNEFTPTERGQTMCDVNCSIAFYS
jgi:hypothetical protein